MVCNQIQKQLRKHKSIVSIILLCIGLLMILASKDNQVISGVGISILASAITTLVTIFFIDDEDRLKTVKDWGLEHVYPTRGEMNASTDAYLLKARSVKTIAFGMASWRDSKTADVKRLLQRGGSIKIITMDPDCDNLKARERDEHNKGIGDSIRDLIKWAERLNGESDSGKIEIRIHDHLPQEFIFLMDNRLFCGPYEYGKGSQQTVSFEYSVTGKAYEYYQDLFDNLWENKEFCRNAFSERSS